MGLWKDRTRGDWRYSFEFEKKAYAGGGYATKAAARSAREDRRKEVKLKKKEEEPTTPIDTGFLTLSNRYLDWSERRHASGNVANKKTVFRKLAAFLELSEDQDFPLQQFTPSLLHDFLTEAAPSNNSYNNYRKEISCLFSYLQGQLSIPDLQNPCLKIEKMPNARHERSVPSKDEFLKLLAACDGDERPLIIILVHSLARIDEILRLTWTDVNFERETLILWTRKNRAGRWKPRVIGMNEDLRSALFSMWKRRKQDKWVFFNERSGSRYLRRPKFMRRICRRAGINHYTFHCIRHFVATYLHDILKVPTGVLSGILGHENKRTTEIYLHSVDEAQRDALKQLEGIFEPQASLAVFSRKDDKTGQ